jgi:hypothetical protein
MSKTTRKPQFNSIKTLADLRGRCVIDGGCWIWRMAASNGKEPRAWYVDPDTGKGRAWIGARLALRLATGIDPVGNVYRPICMDAKCINPDHLKTGTRAEVGAWWAGTGKLKGNPRVIAANTVTGRKYSKLTLADAALIRKSDETGIALAMQLGVNQTLVSAIRLGKKWKDAAANGSSVFAWRPAA